MTEPFRPIPVQEPAFAFTTGLDFREYLAQKTPEALNRFRDILRVVRLQPDDQAFFTTYPNWLSCVLLVEEDVPDTFLVTPVLARIAEACPRLELRVVLDDADLTLLNDLIDEEIDLFTDLDDLDLPLLFVFDEEWNQQGQWGPRPAAAEERLDAWLAANPDYERLLAEEELEDTRVLDQLMDELTEQMRLWYYDDLNQETVAEIRALLESIGQETSTDEEISTDEEADA